MAVVLLLGMVMTTVSSVSWSMAKLAVTGVTVRAFVAVAPRAVAVMVTAPVVAPVTVVVNMPLLLVVPVAFVIVTLPTPDWVKVTAAPGTIWLPASFAVAVRVTVVALSLGIDDADDASVTMEPTICMGICADTVPAVAVIVTVRLVWFPP